MIGVDLALVASDEHGGEGADGAGDRPGPDQHTARRHADEARRLGVAGDAAHRQPEAGALEQEEEQPGDDERDDEGADVA